MTQTLSLRDRLRRIDEEDPEWDRLYDEVVRDLRQHDLGAAAPAVGEIFPDFTLPDMAGRLRGLQDLLGPGPLILSLNRGQWCPYCQEEIAAWAEQRARLDALGARLVVISGERGGLLHWISDLTGDRGGVLADPDLGLALALGLAFRCSDRLRAALLGEGIDFAEIYGNASWFLPVPATFALDPSGRIRFAFADPDFRKRAEPAEVLDLLARG